MSVPLPKQSPVYRPRKPHLTPFYQCVQDHWEVMEGCWEGRFQKRYGPLRPHMLEVMVKYLACGDLHAGFARLKCQDCGRELLLGFSCKCRHFCPSCHQKRAIEFGDWCCSHVLQAVPHRHLVCSLPKILRRYFLYDRKLLADLSRLSWEAIKEYLQAVAFESDLSPAAIISTQSFGDFPDKFHPHLHIICADGFFTDEGDFVLASRFNAGELRDLFRHKVLKMLLGKGIITRERIAMIEGWTHSGFNVHCGPSIMPDDVAAMESLAAYILRASFSQQRMEYLPDSGKVIYRAKSGRDQRTYDPLEWLAAMMSHLPLKGEQLVKYYGHYSNRARGDRRKSGEADIVPLLLESEISSKEAKRKWSYFIRKIYEVDPLKCDHCGGKLKIISFIHDEIVIQKILEHLGLWLANARAQPRCLSPPQAEYRYGPECQLPVFEDDFCQLPPTAWEC